MSDYGRLLEENIALRVEIERLKAMAAMAPDDKGVSSTPLPSKEADGSASGE